MNKEQLIFQFKISLYDIEPLIWRRIQVPATYSFWDLHIALQDAMGWLDYHLHALRLGDLEIGIKDPDAPPEVIAGHEVGINKYFKKPGETAIYEYDFGDNWKHKLLFEGIILKDNSQEYPYCIGGERACPPEDCGGIYGYENLVETLKRTSSEDYKEMVEWLKNHHKNYHPYKPNRFDLKAVKFDNPEERWIKAFSK